MQKQMPVMATSIFILVYLFSHMVVARPALVHPRQGPPAPPFPGAPPPTTSEATTWTYNYWWPYPPASDTASTPIATAAPKVAAAPGQGPFLLPIPEPSPTPIPDGNGDINSLIYASVDSTSSLSSAQPSSPSPSTTTSSIPNNSEQNDSDDKKRQKSNMLYLILFFSIWGFLSLAVVSWLIYGCCIRRSRHLSSRRRPYSTRGVPGGHEHGCNKERKGVLVKSGEVNEATFRAFRYEDLTAKPVSQHSFETDLEVNREASEVVCEHVKEYGFECDCRPSSIESRENRFGWPRVQLENTPIDNGGAFGNENEDGDVHRPKNRSIRTRTDAGECSAAVFTPLEILSDSCSEPGFTPASDRTEKSGMQGEYFGSKDGGGRRGKLLEGIWSQSREREEVSLQRAVKATKKRRRTVRSAKSVKSTKTSRTAWTERSIYSGDGDDNDEVERSEGGGFRMMVESPPPIPEDTAKSFKVDLSRRRSGDESEGWVGKVTNAIGSSFSKLSGNQDEDRYTSLPDPQDYKNLGSRSQHRRSQAKRAHRIGEQAYISGHPQFGGSAQSPQGHAIPRFRRENAIPESRPEDRVFEMTMEEIAEQRKRLQNHRASLASLPAGMMYSPPLVGVSVFGEESRWRPGASVSLSNVQEVDGAVAERLQGRDDGGRRGRGNALPRYLQ